MPSKVVDIEHLPTPRTERIPLGTFLNIAPFPGHRNSEGRASKAIHLHRFEPVHLQVDLAECREPDGSMKLFRLTGNTRAMVWQCGLSDAVPSAVVATIYPCDNEAEIQTLGSKFDAQAAAWQRGDYAYRAVGIAFGDQWRPISSVGKSVRLSRAMRLADTFSKGHYTPDKVSVAEHIMPNWTREIRDLDRLCEAPLVVENGNISTGIQAAWLLLLRFEDIDPVEMFISRSIADEGTKTEDGMDGVQVCAEQIKARGANRRRNSATIDVEDAKRVLSAFKLFTTNGRTARGGVVDPVRYCREAQKASRRLAS